MGTKQLATRHCYHSLSWYSSFDTQGLSSCEPNYFIAGLYRSGDSLYNLQMAKCCSFRGARWVKCEKNNWGTGFSQKGWVVAAKDKWYTSLWRGQGHQLKDLQQAKACGYAKGF